MRSRGLIILMKKQYDMCGNCKYYRPKDEKKGTCKKKLSSWYVKPTSILGCEAYESNIEQK